MADRPWVPLVVVVVVLLIGAATAVSFVPGTWTRAALAADGATACAGSGPLAVEPFWTPLVLVDSPYRGFAQGTAVTFEAPGGTARVSQSVTALNGEAVALLSLDAWALERRATAPFSPEASGPNCPSAWTAVDLNRSGLDANSHFFAVVNWMPVGAVSDRGEPSQESFVPAFGTTSIPTVLIPVGFTSPNLGTTEACDGAGVGLPTFPAPPDELRFTVPFQVGSGSVSVGAAVAASVTYSYGFDANATGVWGVDDSSVSVGYGLAFSWTACS